MVTQLHSVAPIRLYTLDEFEELDFPADGSKYELIDGELVVTPPAGDEHGRIGSKIVKKINLLDPDDKLGLVWQTTRFKVAPGFGPAPDVGFVMAGRVPKVSKGAVEAVPDLVVEVWSPRDLETKKRRDEAMRKIRRYQTAGVRLIWAVNPAQKVVEVYHPDQSAPVAVLGVDKQLDGEGVIPGFKMAVRRLFEE